MIWLAVILYSVAAIGLGWYAGRVSGSADEFWTAGRRLSGVSVGLSISAGFMSVSWSCVYAVQLFYWYGLGAIWLITIPWLLTLVGIGLLAKRYHDLPSFSQPEMVGRRFGNGARRTVALALAFVFVVWGGAEIYIAAKLLAPGLGIPVPWIVVGISIIVAIYSMLGGFGAVVLTDKLQYVIVAFYILAMGWLASIGMGGVEFPASEVVAAKSGASWTNPGSPGIAVIVLTFVAYLPGWLFETDLWVRVQAARDDRAAKQGVLIAFVSAFLFVGVLPLFIGITALEIFPMEGGSMPADIGFEGDAIFAALVGQLAPNWLSFLVAIGLVAAAMSTIDTCANVVGLSIGYDMLELQSSDRGASRSRLVTLVAMVALCVFALNTESLWDIFYLSGGILTTAVAFPVAAVFFSWANPGGVRWSSGAGLTGTMVAYFLESRGLLAGVEPMWMAETGLGFIVIGGLIAVIGYAAGTLAPR